VKGGFALQPGNNKLTWFEAERQRLVWSEGARWYSIEFRPNLNVAGTMDRDQLIHLAESLIASPIETTEPLSPNHLTSISDAEKISGLDLKAPTLLPMDISFSYGRYFPDGQQVRLIYGPNEELTVQVWEGEPINYNKSSNVYEIVHINGDVAYYDHSDGSESHLFLWWQKDGLNYHMVYDQSIGGRIDKDKMLLIAESMQDIDDFSKKSGRPYEQVAIYEQALGIDAKKFSEAPAGWTFANFWGDAYDQCIGLIYTATTRQDTLLIKQCKTDKRLDISVYPFWSVKRVKVDNAKGSYVAGGFVMTDDGKQVWDPTLPSKQLYWQEDGLWMQIVLYGDEALLLDKDDLISIAESLK
jgi:hypothetical protein